MTNHLWSDYALLDSGDHQKLERFGKYILSRPDNDISWPKQHPELWSSVDAEFKTISKDKGFWSKHTAIPDRWLLTFGKLRFWAKLTPYKHTGVFPEQIPQWEFLENSIKSSKRPLKILNLFAYTGIATLVAAAAGAEVTHVDSSKPALTWFRENQEASNLMAKPVRIILDDVIKFICREEKRGHTYDGILMDPPVYGHGIKGEVWSFQKMFPSLLAATVKLLSPQPLFLQVNTYTLATSLVKLNQQLATACSHLSGNIQSVELVLTSNTSTHQLAPAIYSRWQSN